MGERHPFVRAKIRQAEIDARNQVLPFPNVQGGGGVFGQGQIQHCRGVYAPPIPQQFVPSNNYYLPQLHGQGRRKDSGGRRKDPPGVFWPNQICDARVRKEGSRVVTEFDPSGLTQFLHVAVDNVNEDICEMIKIGKQLQVFITTKEFSEKSRLRAKQLSEVLSLRTKDEVWDEVIDFVRKKREGLAGIVSWKTKSAYSELDPNVENEDMDDTFSKQMNVSEDSELKAILAQMVKMQTEMAGLMRSNSAPVPPIIAAASSTGPDRLATPRTAAGTRDRGTPGADNDRPKRAKS